MARRVQLTSRAAQEPAAGTKVPNIKERPIMRIRKCVTPLVATVGSLLMGFSRAAKLYHILGENNLSNVGEFSWEKAVVRQKGLRLFSIRF